MTRYFFALSSPIDCMYPDGSDASPKHAAIGAGLFNTLDADLAAFLQTPYPDVLFLGSQEEVPAIQPPPPDTRPIGVRREVT